MAKRKTTTAPRRNGSRRRYKSKVSLAMLAGLAYPIGQTARWYKTYKGSGTGVSTMFTSLGQAFLQVWLGYSTFVPGGAFVVGDALKYTYLPIATGYGVHWLANRFGINRWFRRVPFVKI